ncbi:MAG TPA: DUF1573 domain-containing protein [Chthoniobacteraceae bacterium]|jgi:hypothetical protein
MFSRTLLSPGLFLALALPALADLHWDQPIQNFRFTPDSKEVEAHFTFRNTGSTTVTITDVQKSCGCTVTKLAKKSYAPGEQGDLVTTYAFHGETGEMRKLFTVFSDDHPKQPVTLDLRVSVHEPFDVKPMLVYWRVGDPAEAKTVQLSAVGFPVRATSVSSSNPRISASLQTVKAGDQYLVSIKPADTAQKESGEVNVVTDFPPEAPKSYVIHVRVK